MDTSHDILLCFTLPAEEMPAGELAVHGMVTAVKGAVNVYGMAKLMKRECSCICFKGVMVAITASCLVNPWKGSEYR